MRKVVPSNETLKLWQSKYAGGLSTRDIAKEFGVTPWVVCKRLRESGVKFRTCSENTQLLIAKGKNPVVKKGVHANNWKGGKRGARSGYVYIYVPEIQRYRREHVVVWERTHGMKLPNGWAVHHLNGVKDDNSPENLMACPAIKHSLLIPMLMQRIQLLEKENTALRHLIYRR